MTVTVQPIAELLAEISASDPQSIVVSWKPKTGSIVSRAAGMNATAYREILTFQHFWCADQVKRSFQERSTNLPVVITGGTSHAAKLAVPPNPKVLIPEAVRKAVKGKGEEEVTLSGEGMTLDNMTDALQEHGDVVFSREQALDSEKIEWLAEWKVPGLTVNGEDVDKLGVGITPAAAVADLWSRVAGYQLAVKLIDRTHRVRHIRWNGKWQEVATL